jgi:site-specific recombinase XerD
VKEGKWARERLVPFGNATGSAITAMMRTRPAAAGPHVLVGERAPHRPVTRSGLAQILEYRCELAGLPRVNPHQLRHTAVSRFFEAGGTKRDAKLIFGWVDDTMADRYGAEASGRIALVHFRAMGLGDGL